MTIFKNKKMKMLTAGIMLTLAMGMMVGCGGEKKEDAIKNLISVKLDDNHSITHDVTGKFTGASVLLKKSPEGTGIIAGGPARSVCELAGIENIRTKSLGSNNKQNVVLATIEALKTLRSPEEVARLRGKSVEEILG